MPTLLLAAGLQKRRMRVAQFAAHVLQNAKVRVQGLATQSFAFSGSGWLLPFHIGVIRELREAKLLTNKTHVSGSSGGSLAALVCVCDIDTEELLEKLVDLSETVMNQNQMQPSDGVSQEKSTHEYTCVDALVRKEIASLLSPSTATIAANATYAHALLERLNRGKNLSICVTALRLRPQKMRWEWQLGSKSGSSEAALVKDSAAEEKKDSWRGPKLLIVNQFTSISALVDAAAASCFIPIYSRKDLSSILGNGERGLIRSLWHAVRSARVRYGTDADARYIYTKLGVSSEDSTSRIENHNRTHVYRGTTAVARKPEGEHSLHLLDVLDGGFLAFLPPICEVGVSPIGMYGNDAQLMLSAAEGETSAAAFYDNVLLRFVYPAIVKQLFSGKKSDARFPCICIPSGKYDLKTLFRWMLVPPKRQEMYILYEDGRIAAKEYLKRL